MSAPFYTAWNEAALTSLGFFWKALWAFVFGYIVSSCIQVFVTRERMRRAMGGDGPGSVGLATFFGFISSSCSFAALAATRSLLRKGAGLVPALAFLLASTNLVIELGFVIAVFLSWQFVVGEYLGGLLLILFTWLLVGLLSPKALERSVRDRLEREHDAGDAEPEDWRELASSLRGWRRVARTYFMEWGMVWKDVTIGFTVAGIISAFVPESFFHTLFLTDSGLGVWATLQNVLVGPVAAFFTFIGSMGNIPLAAVLYGSGVSFAGVMAFIFSDLVVFPVIRIHARYYGWRMALFIAGVFLVALACAALVLHWGFAGLDLLPPPGNGTREQGDFFSMGYGFLLNVFFLAATVALFWLAIKPDTAFGHDHDGHAGHDHGGDRSAGMERALFVGAVLALAWLCGGLLAGLAG